MLIPIASTLALGLSDWLLHCFEWKLSAEGVTNAIVDGYFQVTADASSPGIDPESLEMLAMIAKFFPNTAVWEFKRVKSGNMQVLEDIITLSKEGVFPWVKCSGKAPCKAHYVHGARMGYDGDRSVCTLLEHSAPFTNAKRKRPTYNGHRTPAIHIIQQVRSIQISYISGFSCSCRPGLRLSVKMQRL
jgi:hypothetical protein